jgi:outer membrane protein TolC
VLAGEAPGAAVLALDLTAITLPALPKIVPSEILARRPDVSAARSQLEAAAANIGVARTARLPQVSITAAFGGGATTFGNMFAAGNSVWSIGSGIVAPLLDGGTLAARQRSAEAEYDAAAAQYRAAALTAFQNVADSLYAVDIDSRALQVADAASASAADVLRFTQSQLDQGYGSRPSMLAARQAWLQAQVAKVAAQGSLLGDSVALYQSASGSIDGELSAAGP